jgi:hypothetical protein
MPAGPHIVPSLTVVQADVLISGWQLRHEPVGSPAPLA